MIVFESEKELEDMLCEHLNDGLFLVDDCHIDFYDRQTNLSPYGITDLILHTKKEDIDSDGNVFVSSDLLQVVELKITELSHSHLSQIARYKTFFDITDYEYEVEYMLICKSSKSYSGDLVFLAQNIEWLSIYTYELTLTDGIVFQRLSGFKISDNKNIGKSLDLIKSKFPNGDL